MQVFYFTAALSSILSLAAAAPAASPIDLVPRACSTRSPSISKISACQPNDNIIAGETNLNRTGPAPYQNTVSTILTFDGFPLGATGCMLKYTVPKTTAQIATANPDYSGSFQADVWLVEAGRPPTWASPPVKQQQVSTVQIPTKPTTSSSETIIWSGTCPQNNGQTHWPYAGQISFLIEASTWQQLSGSAKLYNSLGGKSVGDAAGFTMVHSC